MSFLKVRLLNVELVQRKQNKRDVRREPQRQRHLFHWRQSFRRRCHGSWMFRDFSFCKKIKLEAKRMQSFKLPQSRFKFRFVDFSIKRLWFFSATLFHPEYLRSAKKISYAIKFLIAFNELWKCCQLRWKNMASHRGTINTLIGYDLL